MPDETFIYNYETTGCVISPAGMISKYLHKVYFIIRIHISTPKVQFIFNSIGHSLSSYFVLFCQSICLFHPHWSDGFMPLWIEMKMPVISFPREEIVRQEATTGTKCTLLIWSWPEELYSLSIFHKQYDADAAAAATHSCTHTGTHSSITILAFWWLWLGNRQATK